MSGRHVLIGSLGIGSQFPVRIESMLRTPLGDLKECLYEIHELFLEGCDLVRVAFPERGLADILAMLVRESPIEIMADIHFDHRLAIDAIKAGCASIRINPGNMGNKGDLAALCRLVKDAGTVVRVGSNSGSLSRSQKENAGGDPAKALFCAVAEQVSALKAQGVEKLILSAKSSSIPTTLRANTLLSESFRHPVHIGLTEAGSGERGIIKSSVALGALLSCGIGDTIRVSMTGPAADEVRVGKRVLQSLEIRRFEPGLVSCPACGRRRVDVASLLKRIEPLLKDLAPNINVALMGCEVNGPQEAASADVGVAGTPSGLMLFAKGKPIGFCSQKDLENSFLQVCKDLGYLV